TGNHPRHLHVARMLAETGLLVGLVIEDRGGLVPGVPGGLAGSDRVLYVRHFEGRRECEYRFFGEVGPNDIDVQKMLVTKESLNGPEVRQFLVRLDPDVLISYGCHKLMPELLSTVRGEKWNVHGGLSPWYRGAITHFWPHYFLEPQMTGMTIHDLSQDLDAGDIVHQVVAPMIRGDGVHECASRAVSKCAEELVVLLKLYFGGGGSINKVVQGRNGKFWRSGDWRVAHLRVVYELFENRIVDLYLDGELGGSLPELHVQPIAGR
ncbi:MAG: formyltransferase family protein, partial [Halothiobacillaceae bacterium]